MSLPEQEAQSQGRPPDDRIELSVPARTELFFLIRMTAAAVASGADFDVDQIDDLKLAIEELCVSLVGDRPHGGRVALLFRLDEDMLHVSATLEPDDSEGSANVPTRLRGAANELSERILDALVDEHGMDVAGGAVRYWLRLRRRLLTS